MAPRTRPVNPDTPTERLIASIEREAAERYIGDSAMDRNLRLAYVNGQLLAELRKARAEADHIARLGFHGSVIYAIQRAQEQAKRANNGADYAESIDLLADAESAAEDAFRHDEEAPRVDRYDAPMEGGVFGVQA